MIGWQQDKEGLTFKGGQDMEDVKRESQVETELCQLERAVSGLSMEFNELIQRLISVIKTEPERTGDPTPVSQLVPLAHRIKNIRATVEAIPIAYVLESLEL